MELHKGDIVFFARTVVKNHIYEVCELKIRTIENTWFVGVDKRDKHAYLLEYSELDKTVFTTRQEALSLVKNMQKNDEKEPEENSNILNGGI